MLQTLFLILSLVLRTLSLSLPFLSPPDSLLDTMKAGGIAPQCPIPDLCFSLNVPGTTVESGLGDVYMKITGPTKFASIIVAQGSELNSPCHFSVHTCTDKKNVTISSCFDTVSSSPAFTDEPKFDLLDGSAVLNDNMNAHIRCQNVPISIANSKGFAPGSVSWAWAVTFDSSPHTWGPSKKIFEYEQHGIVRFDTPAMKSSDQNPLLRRSSSAWPVISHGPPKNVIRMYTAHAVLACLAWAFIFPLGGIMIRLLSFPGLLWTHACLQIFGFCMYIASVSLGIKLSINPKFWRMENKHVLIGLIIFGLFFVQIFTGYIHHVMFLKTGKRTTWSWLHLWSGRVCVTLGIMNAGFGFQITHKGWSTWEVKVYTIFAVVVWIGYVASILVGESRRRKRMATVKTGEDTGEGMTNATLSGMTRDGAVEHELAKNVEVTVKGA